MTETLFRDDAYLREAPGKVLFADQRGIARGGQAGERLNELIAIDAPVRQLRIPDEERETNPALVKTMSGKPPTEAGRVWLLAIEGLDLQPCAAAHVARTAEIGYASVTQIEKKVKINRRVPMAPASPLN